VLGVSGAVGSYVRALLVAIDDPPNKTCAPRASDRELARVLSVITDHRIHNETVKALLGRIIAAMMGSIHHWRFLETLGASGLNQPISSEPLGNDTVSG